MSTGRYAVTEPAHSSHVHCTIDSWVYCSELDYELIDETGEPADETRGFCPSQQINLTGITNTAGWLWPVDFELDEEWLEDELLYWKVNLELCVTRAVSFQHPQGGAVTNAMGETCPILGVFTTPFKPETPRSLPSVSAEFRLNQEAFGDFKDCLILAARNQGLRVEVSLKVCGLEADIPDLRWPEGKNLDITAWEYRLIHQGLGNERDNPSNAG